jgi:hypothetical protein
VAVMPRPLPAAPFLVRQRCLIVVLRPLPAAPLAVRRTYLILVLRPVLRPLLGAAASGERHSADEQKSRVDGNSFGRTYVIVR